MFYFTFASVRFGISISIDAFAVALFIFFRKAGVQFC